MILAKYSEYSTTSLVPTEEDFEVCDVNKDKKIDSVDASSVLAYYAFISVNVVMDLTSFLDR